MRLNPARESPGHSPKSSERQQKPQDASVAATSESRSSPLESRFSMRNPAESTRNPA